MRMFRKQLGMRLSIHRFECHYFLAPQENFRKHNWSLVYCEIHAGKQQCIHRFAKLNDLEKL